MKTCFSGNQVFPSFSPGKHQVFSRSKRKKACHQVFPRGKPGVLPPSDADWKTPDFPLVKTWCFPGLFLENTWSLPGENPTFQQNTRYSPGVLPGEKLGFACRRTERFTRFSPGENPVFSSLSDLSEPASLSDWFSPGENLFSRFSPGENQVKTWFLAFRILMNFP